MLVDLKEVERVSNVEIARKALAEIKAAHAEKLLTAEDVVSTASDPDHPLHKYFEWQNVEAAHQYRLAQARGLIRKVLVIGPDNGDETPVPKYVSLRKDRNRKGGGYRETRDCLNSKQLLAELEETAKADIEGVLQRYQMLKALCERVRKAAGIKERKEKRK